MGKYGTINLENLRKVRIKNKIIVYDCERLEVYYEVETKRNLGIDPFPNIEKSRFFFSDDMGDDLILDSIEQLFERLLVRMDLGQLIAERFKNEYLT